MRMARAREMEPDDWEVLSGRPHAFDKGEAVVFDGVDEPMRVKGIARLEIRDAGRLLIALFVVVYAPIAVWGSSTRSADPCRRARSRGRDGRGHHGELAEGLGCAGGQG